MDSAALMRGLVPSRTRPAGEELADRLVTAIAVGGFVPGQRLPAERDLADMLGVSRTTVRDALARLCELGLIEVRRGRTGGAFVRSPWGADTASSVRQVMEPHWAELEQAMDLRDLVEATVARTAAERRTRADVREIHAALRDYEKAADLAEAQRADLRLHTAITAAAHSPRLLDLHVRLLSEVNLGFPVEPFTSSIYERALTQHRELATAVADGDVQAAWDVGRQHFSITADQLRQTRERAAREPG